MMRISTNMIFNAGVEAINRQWASLLHVQQQIAAGRRILTPADDPVAAARVLEVQQAKDITSQYSTNQNNAKSALGLEEAQLTGVTDMFLRFKELVIQAGNGTITQSNRQALATELRAHYDRLLGIANATDGSGDHMFAGYKSEDRPFTGSVDDLIASGGDVQYHGDDGQRRLQVAASRYIEVSDPGSDVFMRVGDGAGGTQSMFRTVADLVQALEDPSNTGAAYAADLASANANFDRGMDNVLRVRAAVGSRLSEIDMLESINTDLGLQYKQTLSNLQDLDYAAATAELARRQVDLEAAQKSFMSTSQLSLFNYL
jgi:flagellar hook-associated protein 3 FlgL